MKNTIQIITLAAALLLTMAFSTNCQAQDGSSSAADGPMPQTREHILLARQISVPLSLLIFDQPEMPGGTVNGCHDGKVDEHDFGIWRFCLRPMLLKTEQARQISITQDL